MLSVPTVKIWYQIYTRYITDIYQIYNDIYRYIPDMYWLFYWKPMVKCHQFVEELRNSWDLSCQEQWPAAWRSRAMLPPPKVSQALFINERWHRICLSWKLNCWNSEFESQIYSVCQSCTHFYQKCVVVHPITWIAPWQVNMAVGWIWCTKASF